MLLVPLGSGAGSMLVWCFFFCPCRIYFLRLPSTTTEECSGFFILLFLPDLNTTAVAIIPSERRNQTPPAAFFLVGLFPFAFLVGLFPFHTRLRILPGALGLLLNSTIDFTHRGLGSLCSMCAWTTNCFLISPGTP